MVQPRQFISAPFGLVPQIHQSVRTSDHSRTAVQSKGMEKKSVDLQQVIEWQDSRHTQYNPVQPTSGQTRWDGLSNLAKNILELAADCQFFVPRVHCHSDKQLARECSADHKPPIVLKSLQFGVCNTGCLRTEISDCLPKSKVGQCRTKSCFLKAQHQNNTYFKNERTKCKETSPD